MERRWLWPLIIGTAIALGGIAIGVNWSYVSPYLTAILAKENAPELFQSLILILTGAAILWQLQQTRKQHHLDRLIAWKSSVQTINQLIVGHAALFSKVLYPRQPQEKVEQLTAAYASLHALEVIYYMRKEDEYPPDRLKEFLVSYVASDAFAELWQFAQYRVAFTQEFQQQINDILGRRPLLTPQPKKENANPGNQNTEERGSSQA